MPNGPTGWNPDTSTHANAGPFEDIARALKEPLRPVAHDIRRALDPLHDGDHALAAAEAKRERRRARNRKLA